MNDTVIITSYVIIDDMMRSLHHRSHSLAKVSDANVLTVVVVAAKYFHNNHERALWVLTQLGYLSERLSTSRFNRSLDAIADWLLLTVETLGALFAGAQFSSLTVCPYRSAAARGRDVIGKCAGATTAATARRRKRSSSAGACIWCARPPAFP